MRLGGKMNHGIASAHGSFQSRRITNVTPHKPVVRMRGGGLEIRQVSGICQLVIINDRVSLVRRKNVANEIGADESRATCYKHLHGLRFRGATATPFSSLTLLAPLCATRLFARRSDSNVPASVHHPSRKNQALVFEILGFSSMKPSGRGELEITEVKCRSRNRLDLKEVSDAERFGVAKDNANRMTISKIFRQAKCFRDSALSFLILIRVVYVLQVKIASIAKETEKISGVVPAGDQQNFRDARVHESLDGVIHHRLVVYGKQVLVRDFRQWFEPTARATS
jgi:hypothetical protein